MGIKTVPQPPYSRDLAPCDLWLFPNSEAVVTRQLRRWKRLWRRSLTCSHKRTSMGPSRSCLNGTRSALQPEEIILKGTNFMSVLLIKVPIWKKSGNLFNDLRNTFFDLTSFICLFYFWFVFYCISTIVRYSMPNPFYTCILNIKFLNTFCR